MNAVELIQYIDPQGIQELLAQAKKSGLTPYKWRLSPTGSTKLGRPFILRAKTESGESIIGDFPTIPMLLESKWLINHVLTHLIIEKLRNFNKNIDDETK